jgi:hypothetical protein
MILTTFDLLSIFYIVYYVVVFPSIHDIDMRVCQFEITTTACGAVHVKRSVWVQI